MPVAASRGLHLCSEIDPTLQPWSLADGLRLRQVLFNLAGNALKFTLQGSVVLQVHVLQQRDGGQRLRLQVTDTGVGISVERQQAVFAAYEQAEASTTRRFGGSGLGLSICRELATSMGGHLHLRSVPGKGTTVWLELDLAACAAPLRDRRWHGPRYDRCRRRGCWWPRIIRPTCSCWHNACASWDCRCTPVATACRHGRPGRCNRSTWSSPTAPYAAHGWLRAGPGDP